MSGNAKNEISITRIFDVPRNQVWKFWAESEMFKKWWGPKDFTAPVIKMDFHVGGKYLYCMRGSDSKDYWSTGTYEEIIPLERIVCTDSFADEHGNVVPSTHYGIEDFPRESQVTVTFEEHEAKTKMTLRHTGIPVGRMTELCQAGWNQSFDKLAESLKR